MSTITCFPTQKRASLLRLVVVGLALLLLSSLQGVILQTWQPVSAAPQMSTRLERIPLQHVVQIAVGGFHSCALTSEGSVHCWGENESGQLGDGSRDDRPAAVKAIVVSGGVTAITAGRTFTCAVTNGGVHCWGYLPATTDGLSNITALTAGSEHACALTSAGSVYCWGANWSGQLGDGTREKRSMPVAVANLSGGVTAIASGSVHTCALVSGKVYCWGDNFNGQLGDGTKNDHATPVAVTGLNQQVITIAAGNSHTCAVTDSGSMVCWGDNTYGQLGDGTHTHHSTPITVTTQSDDVTVIAAGAGHTCAVTESRAVLCWGWNSHGELGNGMQEDSSTPVSVIGLRGDVTSVATGIFHTCAMVSSGGVQCWGNNNDSQVGDGTGGFNHSTPRSLKSVENDVRTVVNGFEHTCQMTSNGALQCWGFGYYGQLGDGTKIDRSTPVTVTALANNVIAVAAGAYHTCALTNDNIVHCWGENRYRQLGDGTLENRTTPVAVASLSISVTAIAAGGVHTCVMPRAGGVLCWGGNSGGQLGDGTLIDRSIPVTVSGLSNDVTSIAAGSSHTCAITNNDRVRCWGWNGYGQLGDGTRLSRTVPVEVSGLQGVIDIAAKGSYTCALTHSGAVYCWGLNDYGQLGDGTTSDRMLPVQVTGLPSEVKQIATGVYHTCAATSSTLYCWGFNYEGQLGDGTHKSHIAPVPVVGLTDPVTQIAASRRHTCVVTDSQAALPFRFGRVQCWGDNFYGELGDGSAWRTTPVDVLAEVSIEQYLPLISR